MDGNFQQTPQFGNNEPQTSQQQPVFTSFSSMSEKQKKGGGKWWIWLVVIFVLILGGVFGCFVYIKGTPQYSLYQMSLAVQNKNYEEFSKYFNIDSVLDDIFNKALEDMKKQYSGFYSEKEMAQVETLAKSQLELAKEQAKDEMKKQIEEGKFSLTKEYKVSFLKVFQEVKVKKLSRDEANVTITNEKGKSVTFTMRKKNGYWEIYKIAMTLEEIKNLIESGQK